ncbi:glycosyltransferase [Streptomyces cocklensis]|uniref:Glycosyltransferase involved in cell wall bisynthesis n=1 Tax=Actinacidiphila cocklensis TaxID=887465 RepID=A0A9W4GSA9_9ACTN|nr:glycosyltransferase [Actinacidiphila cocklensis]MDD1057132.1 glycosyltransferase [Actinacidiphila cocklensis]WSX78294.1 glycosyltransferase [Streptomyces sp. NBC_00899]CAG6395134.1 Glycosyltransferase involved in cell wall bisynthesis [Actinacidiphila cocklensis]
MKVVHVITGLGIGGAEQQLRLLLRHLPPERATCHVVTLTNPGPVADGIRSDGTGVTHLGMAGNRDLRAVPRLARLIRSGGFDLVHTHLYRACVYGRVAARLAGVRAVVATEHSLGDSQIEGRPLSAGTRALYRATERMGTGTAAVSATVVRRLRAWGVADDRIHLAPNGIDPSRFRHDPAVRSAVRGLLGLPPAAYTVAGVGRLVPAKRFDLLVRAAAANAGTFLLIAGDGPERGNLLRLAADLGAADRVIVVSAQDGGPDVPEVLAAADLFVSPSPEEAFGLAVVEALAAGLPVLYAACPAIEDLPPHDAPGARRIGGDPRQLAAAIGRQRQAGGPARLPVPAAVDQYHIAHTADRVLALYASALASATKK